jgi:hypothetical protein
MAFSMRQMQKSPQRNRIERQPPRQRKSPVPPANLDVGEPINTAPAKDLGRDTTTEMN